MITISMDLKTAEITPGFVLYTEDGKNFTQVETATNKIISMMDAPGGPNSAGDALLTIATWGPIPEGANTRHWALLRIGGDDE